MNVEDKIEVICDSLINAPDSDEVGKIVGQVIDELVHAEISGTEYVLFIKVLIVKLRGMLSVSNDYIEYNNIKRAIVLLEDLDRSCSNALRSVYLN